MGEDTPVSAKVINIWAYHLNREEQFRNRSMPHRLFCTTKTMTDEMGPPTMSIKDTITSFSQKLKECMLKPEEMLSLRTVDMQKAFVGYLKSVKHPRVNSMSKVKANIYKMKWRTVDSNNDSRIFVMRHMETYKGETVSRYDPDFVKECGPQAVQLLYFRFKYMTKILLSIYNNWRAKVNRLATDFAKKNDFKLAKPKLAKPKLLQAVLTGPHE